MGRNFNPVCSLHSVSAPNDFTGNHIASFLLLLLVWCARLDRDPAHSAHGFGRQVASLVLWFGVDDWVIDRINREPMRMLMPSPATDHEPYCRHVPINKT